MTGGTTRPPLRGKDDDLVRRLAPGLRRGADGIHRAPERHRAVSYPEHAHAECFGVEDRSFWFRHRNECIVSLVRNHSFPEGPFLDIGGGNGYVAQRLVAEGLDVVLVEPGPDGAENARRLRGLEHVVCATVDDAGFAHGSFGAIGMFDVIEHIEDDRGFLERIVPLLKPHGRLYLTVPCHDWLWSQADVDAGHFRRHDRASLSTLTDGLFRLDYLGAYFGPLLLPQFLLRALPYRLGFRRGAGLLAPATEHGSDRAPPGLGIIQALLDREARRIANGECIRRGASCLVAATRR